jgi:hypothetical protein
MKISTDIALWIQKCLLGLDGEDWSVGYMTDGIPTIAGHAIDRWQVGVDLVYRTLTCDLIGVDVFMECHDRTSFLHAIRRVSPYEELGGFLWNGTRVHGTKRLSKLINDNFPPRSERDDKLNPVFIEALEAIFAENGVPWSDKALLPITPAGAGKEALAPR